MGERITTGQYFKDAGCTTEPERTRELGWLAADSIVPALCSDGCEVEPDGECQHGHPSILVALGMI